ncbi:MAG: uracil-DNA glycosylase [Sulfitobacter sp.]|nr:uracil-DNA glycosylase [Sulfitobacter sp.]
MSALDLSRLGAWHDLPFFRDDLPRIEAALAREDRPVFPPAPAIFQALERTQPEDTRVVILGQDPYPQRGKGHGLAFSIPEDFPPRTRRDSLDNIFQELHDDLGAERRSTDLTDWADQGVLLLNALSLTVPESKAGGHRALGWYRLTAEVLERLSDRPRAYMLWGKDAHQAARNVDTQTNFVLKSSHPSPMGVHKAGQDFVAFKGSRPFSRTNDWLKSQGSNAINWADPEGT